MVPWYTEAFRYFAAVGTTAAALGLWTAAVWWSPQEPPWVRPLLKSVALWWTLWAAYRWFVVVVDLSDLDSEWVLSIRRGDVGNILMGFGGISAAGIAFAGRSMYTIAAHRHRRLELRVNGT